MSIRNGKKVLCGLFMLTALAMALPAKSAKKSKKNEKSPYDSLPILKDEKGKKYDLGGMKIIIADWWSPKEVAAPKNAKEEADQAYRAWMQKTYNFTIQEVGIDSWTSHPQTFTNYVGSGGDSNNYVFVMDFGTVAAPMKSGLFYDLSSLKNINLSDKKWQPAIKNLMTRNGKVYGMRAIDPEPRLGVYFNKRLLKEAGVDPESIYEMQKAGTWTWDAFEKICAKVTRDVNNDGIVDVYGMTDVSSDFFRGAAFSNNACFIGRDKSGKYYNATNSNEFIEAMTWACKMFAKYEMPVPDGSAWDYPYASFINGKAAFQAHYAYQAGNLKEMKDDFGFVCFPKGPRMSDYTNVWIDNIYVIPSCYDKARAEKIAFAFNLYSTPTPGYENDTGAWKSSYYGNFRDTRAVDETLDIMTHKGTVWYDKFITGLEPGDIIWHIFGGWETPEEAIENVKTSWQGLIDESNK